MSLLNKIKKNSKIEQTSSLEDSIYLNNQESIACSIPSLNIAMAGEVDCGMSAGTLQIAGPSKHFKTAMGLQVVASYLRQYEDAVCLFYDSEFGAAMRYFEAAGVDTERVVHSPIVDIEQLKIDIVNQMAGVQRGDRLIIFIDSIGNLASRKEVEDAMDSKTTADMTRAKQMKSLFRIITPHLVLKNVYLVAINHTYKEMSTHPRDIVSGGCLVAGTDIKMADGTVRAIEDVSVGDMVCTMAGPRQAVATWCPDTLMVGTPECFEVEFEDGTSVVCSDEHRFLVDGEWVEAKNLSAGVDVYVE